MSGRAKHHFWRKCRVYFRRFRITVWLALLTVVCALVYLNVVGLPGFAKGWIVEELRAHGLDLEFSRLRLDWYHGVVADNVRFNRADEPNEPRFTAKRVLIHPSLRDLVRLRLRVDSLGLRDGRIEWPVTETNASLTALNVEDIEARLRLNPGDDWVLDEFNARLAHATISVTGSITNASALPRWKWFKKREPDTPRLWLQRLQTLSTHLQRVSFDEPPRLQLAIKGDALRPESFTARLKTEATNARTPWGDARKLSLVVQLLPEGNDGASEAELNLNADTVQTPWGGAKTLNVTARMFPEGIDAVSKADVTLNAEALQTQWGQAATLHAQAGLVPDATNWISNSALKLEVATIQTPWGSAQKIILQSTLARNPNPLPYDESLGLWTKALPWSVNWDCEATGLSAHKMDAQRLVCGGHWLGPRLAVTNLFATLGGGTLNANAQLDVNNRELAFALDSTIDPRAVETVLTPKTRLWLTKFSWLSNPHVSGSAAVTLPVWTNRQPDWRGEVQPTLRLAAQFAATNVAYRGVQALWARSRVSYTNLVWQLPDLQVHRAEGTLELAHQEDDRTRDYHWHIRGPIDPYALRPLLETNQLRVFEIISFTGPLTVDGDIWGRLYEYDRIGFQVRVAATNFAVRGHVVETLDSDVRYTNRVLQFFQPNVTRGAQMLYANGVTVDFPAQRIHFTNGFSMAHPQEVAEAIGPKVGAILKPYHFIHPPVVRVEGYAPLRGSTNADLRFAVDGGPFEWWKFKVPQIEGNVHWKGETLLLTNMQMEFYRGNGRGFAFFDFDPGRGGNYEFALDVTNVNFHAFMSDIGSRSNRMEGDLSGFLVVTHANLTNWHSWDGYGRMQLTDGYLWDIPLFGIFSPILNGIIPGMGGGRATEAAAPFIITNGVVFSDSLNMRSTMMRLQYEGTVDFHGTVNARVEAELLRDAWLVGRALSLVFKPVTKLLEYRVTGTLSKPKPEPLYFIPRLLMLPLHPIRTLEELLPSSFSSTNAPSSKP